MTAGGIARRPQDVASSRRRSAFASSSMTGSAFQRIRLQIFEGDELERGGVRCFKIDRGRATVIKRSFPARDADAPFITRFQAGETPFRMRRDQIVSVEHGEIEKLARDLNANGVQTKIFRTGATKPVAIKSGYWIAATTFQFSSKNIRRHNHRTIGLINR